MTASFSEITFETDRPVTIHGPNLRVMQREFAHDIASVKLVALPGRIRHLERDVPVTVRWGRGPNGISSFLGYVNHTEPVQLPSPTGSTERNQIKVVCVGATSALKDQRQQSWQRRNIPSIVREILRSHRLSGIVQSDSRVFESLSANGVSDWVFLVELAQRLGWTVFGSATEVTFRDPLADIVNQRAQAPQFVGQPPGSPETPGGGSVITFKVIDGHTPDGGVQGKRVAHGLDPRLLQSYRVEDSGASLAQDQIGRVTETPDRTIFERMAGGDLGTAQQNLSGTVRRNRWHIQAKAELVGNARVRQATLVSLVGVGPRDSGYWYVEQIEHEVARDGYRMFATLGRDAAWDTGERPDGGRGRRVVRPRNDPFGSQRDEVPPSILVNKKWRAAYSVERTVAGVA